MQSRPDLGWQNILYARVYSSGMGYSYSETNSLVNNLKKEVPTRGDLVKYKEASIERFAVEVAELLNDPRNGTAGLILTPMPPSKTEKHPNFDDRLERVCRRVAEKCGRVRYVKLLRAAKDMPAAHKSSGVRSLEDWMDAMELVPGSSLVGLPGDIVLLDDVLTSGVHFEAGRRTLQAAFPDRSVTGIFWAKAVVELRKPWGN